MKQYAKEENYTINGIISELIKSGINSKQEVINKLSNLSKEDLLTLKQDIKKKLCEIESGGKRWIMKTIIWEKMKP